jgi:dihydrofolate synthase/folylpolyglutamate synthase
VKPSITIITPIGYDHQQYLGNNLQQIAAEKAGIIKPGIPCVTNNTDPQILEIFQKKCGQMDSTLYTVDPDLVVKNSRLSVKGSVFDLKNSECEYTDLEISLAGRHQLSNAALAVASVMKLPGVRINEEQIRTGLREAQWPGRLQIIEDHPLVLLDVAHNIEGFHNVFYFLKTQLPDKKISIIIGLAKDKDYQKIVELISKNVDRVAIVRNFSERGLPVDDLKNALNTNGTTFLEFDRIEEAYPVLKNHIHENELLLIIGSHYLAGEFLKKYKNIDFS